MNDPQELRKRFLEKEEQRIEQVEFDWRNGNQREKKAAAKQAQSWYQIWGQNLQEIEQTLAVTPLDDRAQLEESAEELRRKLKRVFAILDPN